MTRSSFKVTQGYQNASTRMPERVIAHVRGQPGSATTASSLSSDIEHSLFSFNSFINHFHQYDMDSTKS